MNKNFGGLIWTNHVLSRMRQRGIKQGDAWAAFRRPDQTKHAKIKGAWVYYKTWTNQKMEVVAKQNPSTSSGQASKWVILSVWSRPVYGKATKKAEPLWKLIHNKIFRRKK